jgi:hypothetical protein
VIDRRREMIQRSIQLFRDEEMLLDDVKTLYTLDILRQASVKAGIVIFIQQQVLEFKGICKAQQDAAQGL